MKDWGRRAALLCFIAGLLLGLWIPGIPVHAMADEPAVPLDIQARSYVLMEMESGRVLADENSDIPYEPASLTKLMTEYVLLRKVEKGELAWDETVTISANAASIGEAQVFLRMGEKRTVEELFHALSIRSANDAAVALAEHVAGSETKFVDLMNQTATELGLTDTHFRNSTGLPMWLYRDPPRVGGKHHMSAADVAELTRRLLLDFPEIRQIISHSRYTFRNGEPREMRLRNTNEMLPGLAHYYEGVDGVKTGYTRKAGYCFAGSAERGDVRLISVVMGTVSHIQRFRETAKLLDHGFDQIEWMDFVQKGDPIPGMAQASVKNGVETEVALAADGNVRYPVRKGEEDHYSWDVSLTGELEAPLRAGTVVGKAKFVYDGEEVDGIEPVPVVVAEDVEAAGWFRLFFRRIANWF
ncbi:D-alanyl-D-alanine carboxypeptidase family protein [Desmospora profundinema]|uniref:serine-type D-Ala-D-Ala carboxypeptidase n=1 Tax=Desmospora profundinema TaxID=1571184 RepID=A0ABU1IKY2_9BACL|nr:D-alanyl-D-alanine carboxypeptidase family protein [Desmospora profundinema]MDR6225351.1 D-alanyl-D-alanine carboxypeptidase (penicillin-binding protein 5/6) [Desmospora profundinema]